MVYLGELSRRLGIPTEEAEREELGFVASELECLEEWIAPIAEARQLFQHLVGTKRFRMVAATNPTMPQLFNRNRLRWAGFDPDDFEWITGTETSSCLKRHPEFFRELLDALGAHAQDCLMIGNDGIKDLTAAKVGIPVFLLRNGHEVNLAPRPGLVPVGCGSYQDLELFLNDSIGALTRRAL
jgi:FMN phosphatase YigB (HAD superfamily)